MGRTTKTKDKVKLYKTIESRTDFFYYMFRNILLFGIPLLIISGLVLSHLSLHSSATISDSESDNVTLTLSTSCTMSSSIIDAHTASLNGGQYESEIGNTKISTYCNDNNGYSIYAVGSSNNVDGNTDLVSSINDNYNIRTGIYDSSSVSSYTPSSWSMKLSPGSGTGINPDTGESITVTPPTIRNNYDSYSLVPENYTLVASRPSRTDMTLDTTASGSYFTTTYDIYAASYQSPGTYTGKVKYLMVHPQSNNQYLSFNEAFAANGKSPITINGNSYYAMQDMSAVICNSVGFLDEASATQLIDTRDNNIYWVAKLKDGHCWMTQNLDLDIGGANTSTLTSENTDISTTASGSGIYTNGYTENNGVWTWSPVSTAITSGRIVSGTSTPNWNNGSNTAPYSAEGGNIYYYTSGNMADDFRYTSIQSCKDANHTESECLHYHTGNYYNWTAAIASNNSTSISADNSKSSNSICPKGWRLPNASQIDNLYNEFGRMLNEYGIIANLSNGTNSVGYQPNGFNKIRSNPLYLVRSGVIRNNALQNRAAYGSYWSNTTNTGSVAYLLVFNDSNIYTAGTYYRNDGWTIRCIAR